MAPTECCELNYYKGTATRRYCVGCGAIEIGPARRIYFNTDFGGLDGVITRDSVTAEQLREREQRAGKR